MMSLPDFMEKQILFIEARYGVENSLQFQNDNILYKKDWKNSNRISCFKVFAIFIIGNFTITSVLIKKCRQYGISLFLLGNNFECYAAVSSGLESNFILRDRQYKKEDELEMAKKLVENKITNQLLLLKERRFLLNFDYKIKEMKEKIEKIGNEKELLGMEGSYSKEFFREYFRQMNWIRRMPRTKYDVNNVLLDIGYTFLFNFIDSLLRLYGFDTYKGFYHKLFFQRKSLSCDIMEPFRCVIDRQLLKSFRLGQINENDFEYKNGKYVLNFDNQRKYIAIFSEAVMKNKKEMFDYVREFYRFFVVEGKKFPEFRINN
ncbi:MAG: type V CRISPR-associated endonuclease Cas1 [Candidatus Moranbacteria bacterium]|jgi:CRISPR-associated protein Cas1|nr:type V CRISPR-associated endonuclease Cas1 [Candidatus Moranbacteria bacterium]